MSDTASSYTVKIHTDNGVSTFTAAAAGTWANIPWDNQPATAGLVLGGEGQFGYSYTLPTPTGLTPGEHATPQPCCHDLEVCASLSEWWPARHVHPTYTRVAEDGGGGGRHPQWARHQAPATALSNAVFLCCPLVLRRLLPGGGGGCEHRHPQQLRQQRQRPRRSWRPRPDHHQQRQVGLPCWPESGLLLLWKSTGAHVVSLAGATSMSTLQRHAALVVAPAAATAVASPC